MVNSKWEHLSSKAQEMLKAAAVIHGIGHTEREIEGFLSKYPCPKSEAFKSYLLNYAGLRLKLSKSEFHSGISFERIDNGLRLSFSKKINEWKMFLGEWGGAGLNLTSSGLFYMAQSGGSTVSIAESLETFIEQCAIVWSAREQNFTIDSVSTSMPDGANQVANKFGLKAVPHASDGLGGWWIGEKCGVGTTNAFERRFHVAAFWPKSDVKAEEQWTTALTSLLEPHWGWARGTESYRHHRDTGDLSVIRKMIDTDSAVRPVLSFRLAVRTGLAELAHKGRVDPPPEDDLDLGDYYDRQLATAKKQDDSLSIYFLSLGQLASGKIDAFPKLLNHLPKQESSAWGKPLWGGAFVKFLFPSAFIPDPIDQTSEVREWFNTNRDAFIWDEVKGVYVHV